MSLSSEDITEILQLYSRYNTAIDTGDGPAFGGTFVSNGVFVPGRGPVEGAEAIAAYGVKAHENLPGLRHNATNIVIDGEGDHATGSAFLIGYDVKGGYKVIVTGRYADDLERTPEGWRFVKRVFHGDG